MNMSAFLAILAFSFFILATVFIAIWVYQDAKQRGLPAGLWTFLVIFSGNFIGLILYLILRKKEQKTICNYCGFPNDINSSFCSKCGKELTVSTDTPIKTKKVWITLTLMCALCAIICLGLLFYSVFNDSGFRYNNQYSSYNANSSGSVKQQNISASHNVWEISFDKATTGYTFKQTYQAKQKPTTLTADITCEGSVELIITQDEKMTKKILQAGSSQINMSEFHKGKIKLQIVSIDASQFFAQISIE